MYESWDTTVTRLRTLRIPELEIARAMRAAAIKGQAFAERLDGSGIRVRYAIERGPTRYAVQFQVREVTS